MTTPTDASERYTRVAIWLHWLVAAGIFVNLFLGLTLETLFAESQGKVIGIHASIGMTVLALVGLRIFWRLTHVPPAHPPSLRTWERHGSALVHFLLYLALVLMPLTGWAILSTNPPPNSAGAAAAEAAGIDAHPNDSIRIWNTFAVPAIGPLNELGRTAGGAPAQAKLHGELEDLHEAGGWLLILLIAGHILAALKHQYLDRHNQFARMGLGRRVPAASATDDA